jgi:hypothetical protein
MSKTNHQPPIDHTQAARPVLSCRQQLTWVSHDTQCLVTALVKSQLDQWSKEHSFTVQQIPSQVGVIPKQPISLAVWAVWQINQLGPICATISDWRHHRQQPTVILAYMAPSLSRHGALVIEAGASLVVQQMHQLQTTLQSLRDRLPLSNTNGSGLTQGLDHLLPWQQASSISDQDY